MDRRSLIKHAGLAGVLAAGVAPAVHAQTAVRWRMASSFPKSLDTIFGSAEMFAKTVKALSGGKFEVSVHAAGDLMPAFGVVDALQNGTVEMAQTAPYYFTGKDSIFAFGCAVPFGLTARQMDAWMEHGGGRKLMDAFYANYNIKSMSAGNTGTQMGGVVPQGNQDRCRPEGLENAFGRRFVWRSYAKTWRSRAKHAGGRCVPSVGKRHA